MLFFKCAITVFGVGVIWLLSFVLRSGRRVARTKFGLEREIATGAHRTWARVTLGVLVAGLVFVVGMEQMIPELKRHTWLFYVHERLFAGPFFVVFLALLFLFDGERWPRLHRASVTICLLWGCIATVLGVIVAWLPHP